MNYEYEENYSKGHGGLALALGLISIALAILVGGFFGLFGVIPAAILAVAAIFLGVASIRATGGRKGKGGLIVGAIGILFSLILAGMTMTLVTFLHSEEIQSNIPTLAKYADDGWKGIGGMFLSMNRDGVDFEAMNEEINQYNQKNNDNGDSATVTTEG